MSYSEAVRRRLELEWSDPAPAVPSFLGTRVLRAIPLEEIVPFIDWSPFFLAWELKGKYPRIFDDPERGPGPASCSTTPASCWVGSCPAGALTANAVYGFFPANSDDDDLVIYEDESRTAERMRLPTLRQQWERDGQKSFRALADYLAPRRTGIADYLGAFAVTAGIGVDELVAEFERDHDDYNAIMCKALTDRLAEALAEMLHRARPRGMGLRPGREPQPRGPDRGEVPRHPAGLRAIRPRPTTPRSATSGRCSTPRPPRGFA